MLNTLKKLLIFIKEHKWVWIVIIIVSVPLLINYVLMTWHFPGIKGDMSDWFGFLSNYSGGIIGGIVAYIIAKAQIDHEKEARNNEEKEKEEFANSIVENLLHEEIRSNIKMIPKSILEALEQQSNGIILRTTYLWGPRSFCFEDFNEIKFELVKYNKPIVRETIEIYKKLKNFSAVSEINKLSKKEAEVYYKEILKWKIRLYI